MGERAGLVIMGMDYAYAAVERTASGFRLINAVCKNANGAGKENVGKEPSGSAEVVLLRVQVTPFGVCHFSYGSDGKQFSPLGESFTAREGKWIGARVGLFCLASGEAGEPGHADFDWFRFALPD